MVVLEGKYRHILDVVLTLLISASVPERASTVSHHTPPTMKLFLNYFITKFLTTLLFGSSVVLVLFPFHLMNGLSSNFTLSCTVF